MKYTNRAGFFMNSAVMTNFRACCHLRIENLVDWTA